MNKILLFFCLVFSVGFVTTNTVRIEDQEAEHVNDTPEEDRIRFYVYYENNLSVDVYLRIKINGSFVDTVTISPTTQEESIYFSILTDNSPTHQESYTIDVGQYTSPTGTTSFISDSVLVDNVSGHQGGPGA